MCLYALIVILCLFAGNKKTTEPPKQEVQLSTYSLEILVPADCADKRRKQSAKISVICRKQKK
jgi:hypothetical protein